MLCNAYYAPTLGVLAASVTALLLWLSARDAFPAIGVTIGTLTAFVLLFARVFAVIELPPDRARPADAAPAAAQAAEAAIDVRDVSFGYTPGRPAVQELSLAVHPGQHVAVVGRTGAGKSTLLSLLARLHEPRSGRAALALTDPRGLDDRHRRELLGYVPQTVVLFTGTVSENITPRRPRAVAGAGPPRRGHRRSRRVHRGAARRLGHPAVGIRHRRPALRRAARGVRRAQGAAP